jgi:ABC-2 type transport system ATP-binding protein
MSEYVLRTKGLTKQYRKQKAVNSVSLNIKKGAIYGFIGPNGAGKTTFLRMISGLAAPTEGEIELFGYQGRDVKNVFERIGVLIEAPGLYPHLNAYDNLKLKAICMNLYNAKYIIDILNLVGLGEVGGKKVKNFSLGMKQRLGLGMALIGEPDLIILDEPINGLDPQGIVEIRETIIKLNKEKNITFLISSHILEELAKLATHLGIINHGNLIEELTMEELNEKCEEKIEIILEKPELVCPVLEELNITNYKVMDHQTVHVFEKLTDVENINYEISKRRIMLKSIGIKRDSLENYYIGLTGGIQYV